MLKLTQEGLIQQKYTTDKEVTLSPTMDEELRSDTGSDIRFHDEISGGSLSRVETYHQLMHHNKKLVYEIKIGVISAIGSIIIIVCLVYIIVQCRRGSAKLYNNYVRNRRPLEKGKSSSSPHDSTESLLNTKTNTKVTISKAHDMEFFV